MDAIDLLMAFYGDDFTGSTDVMESLSCGGIETVLFVQPPTDELLTRYRHVRAIGTAGSSRAMSPDEMDAHLPQAFQQLLRYQPPFVHYKTCSTFDSSPGVGSIGRAIDIGLRVCDTRVCPLVVGAPPLQRFCVFGNLFARSGLDSAPYRLDRHPTMRCHPITPMQEADLRLHLARQTDLPVHLVDVLTLDKPDFDGKAAIGDLEGIVLFDTLRHEHLGKIGRAIWETRQHENKPTFIAGSSGAAYALVEFWKAKGWIDRDFQWTASGAAQEQVLVVSGSCSPVTERQIRWSVAHGFAEFALDTLTLDEDDRRSSEIDRVVASATSSLRSGRSVIVHTCCGPHDERIQATRAPARLLGETLASVLTRTLAEHPLPRVAVTGGDTSGHVARKLGIDALEMVGPLAPGSPLCKARSSNKTVDGIEITFKGGQVGHDDFFETLLKGKPRGTS